MRRDPRRRNHFLRQKMQAAPQVNSFGITVFRCRPNNGSERIFQRDLEGPRASRAEELSRCVKRMVEIRGIDGVGKPGVVPVGGAQNIGDVEEVEHIDSKLQAVRFTEMERFAQSYVKRIEIITKIGIGAADGT